jgi:arylsulfatase A-like enzyme
MEETVRNLASGSQPFYLQLHTYAVHGPVKARPDLREEATERAKSKKMAEYLGFIAGVDENVGRLLAVLEDPNRDGDTQDSILENTMILITSDNGGTHTNNLPLRGEKGMFTEGGIRVPLIVSWEGHLPAGQVSQRMVHAVDYYPTCLDVAGGEWMPPGEVHPLDGESFLEELLQPGSDEDRGPVCYLFPGYLDQRAQPGAWVINEVDGSRFKASFDYEKNAWSLFNLSEDVGEEKDLATENKNVLVTLAEQLDNWLTQKGPTWQPKYPIRKEDGLSAGKPPQP